MKWSHGQELDNVRTDVYNAGLQCMLVNGHDQSLTATVMEKKNNDHMHHWEVNVTISTYTINNDII